MKRKHFNHDIASMFWVTSGFAIFIVFEVYIFKDEGYFFMILSELYQSSKGFHFQSKLKKKEEKYLIILYTPLLNSQLLYPASHNLSREMNKANEPLCCTE